MINQQIIDYIKQQLQKNISKEQIKSNLISNGWSGPDVEEGFNAVTPPPSSVPPIPSPSVSPNIHLTPNFANPVEDQQDFINKWSWGGLLLYVFYFLGSRNYKRAFLYFLGVVVPILNIYLWIKSGLRGRKLVWESGKWQDFELYKIRQKLLDKIGLIILVINILVLIASFVFGFGKFSKNFDKTIMSENPVVNQETLSNDTSTTPTSQISSPTTIKTSPDSSQVSKSSNTKIPQSNIPLEITQATLNSSQLTYPFTGTTLKVLLKNNTAQEIKEYYYRFALDEIDYFGQSVGNNPAHIAAGAIYQVDSQDTQSAIEELASSCDFFGLSAGQYHLHVKISTDTSQPLLASTTGPQVTDKLIPFTLTKACQKK